ncbi:MAG: hypothetical protein WAZ40_01125 [Minisyncoccia bacterium]
MTYIKKTISLFVLGILLIPVSYSLAVDGSFVGPNQIGTTIADRDNPYSSSFGSAMDFKGFVDYLISYVVKPLTSIILGATIVFFLWNMMGAVKNSDNPEERAKMKQKAIWGIIAIAVMVSLWGLVGFLVDSLLLNDTLALDLERFGR